MKSKIYLSVFFCIVLVTAQAQKNGIQKKYDRATFTVIPVISHIRDTLAADTLYNWSKLPYYSLLLSDVSQNFIQTILETGEKFYYNPTKIPPKNNLAIGPKDTIAFENLFGLQKLNPDYERTKFKIYDLPKYTKIPDFSLQPDYYSEWLKNEIEKSSIPGQMMIQWTNQDVLINRAEGNTDIFDKIRKADKSSFNYFKKLLEKNYIVVQNIIHTSKFTVDPKILEAERKAKEVAQKNKSFFQKLSDFKKSTKKANDEKKAFKKAKAEGTFTNPYLVKSQKYNPNRLILDSTNFLKAYVYRIVLTENLMSDLSSYPPVEPKNAKLEFVCSINTSSSSFLSNTRIKSQKAKSLLENEGIMSGLKKGIKGLGIKKIEYSERYVKGKNSVIRNIENGEYLCAKQITEQLKQYTNAEIKLLDSLIKVCEVALKKSPKINQMAFKNASKIQQNNPEDFKYQTNCENFEAIRSTTTQTNVQESFDKVVGVLEKKIKDFQILASAEKVTKNKIEANIDINQGIYLNQQFKIVERSINKKGERYDNRIGTARVIKVSKGLYVGDSIANPTVLAQIDGRKIDKGALMIQDEVKGVSVYAGYGYRYKDNALIFGVDFSNNRIAKFPGLKIGLNAVMNTTLINGYTPIFGNLVLSRELYFSRILDFKPFVEVGYGGDFINDTPVKRSVLLTTGVGVPINVYSRKTSGKIKIMPEVSFSTEGLRPQFSIQSKIEF